MLITKTDILSFKDISKSVRDDKINPFIKDAERFDFRPLLGENFYNDLVNNQGQTIYTNLLDPLDYTYNGDPYKHGGLKEVLVCYSWARYIMFGSFTDAPFGTVKKKTQDSEPLTYQEKKSIYTMEQQNALTLWGDVERYIRRFSDSYPLWNNNYCAPNIKKTFKVSKISR